eukprot:scaffold15551_cov62-Phaeocystis_antarctica.AAC.11
MKRAIVGVVVAPCAVALASNDRRHTARRKEHVNSRPKVGFCLETVHVHGPRTERVLVRRLCRLIAQASER